MSIEQYFQQINDPKTADQRHKEARISKIRDGLFQSNSAPQSAAKEDFFAVAAEAGRNTPVLQTAHASPADNVAPLGGSGKSGDISRA